MKLVGSNAESGKVKLTDFVTTMKESFRSKKYDDIVIESDKDLGEVQVVVVGNGHEFLSSHFPCWFVDFVIIHNFQSRTAEQFPCYHWIDLEDHVSFTAHTSETLAIWQDVANNPILLKQREDQLEQRRAMYKWKIYPEKKLPSCIDSTVKHLPPDERFHLVKQLDFTEDAIKVAVTLGVHSIFDSCESIHNYEKWAKLLGHHEVPVYVAACWEMDVEFGRQMLNGMNPVVIEKCSSLPSNFHVTNEMVKGFLNCGRTLEQEMEDGHVYICNLKIMEGLQCREGYYCCAPMCLLYVNGSDQLVPIAIQLNQKPGDENPVFLPSDHLMDWLLAKIYYQSAHLQFHELLTHYLSCHAVMEAYCMATMRNLPDPHPIYKLLRPHFRYTMSTNARGRATMMNEGGIVDKIFAIGGEGKVEAFKRAFANYSVYCTNIKRNITKRGVNDPNQLPGYYYHDDGLKIWADMETYVNAIVNLFYHSDTDIKNDTELQQWAQEIHEIAFPAFRDAPAGHGFPNKIETRENLTELCTLIMFTGSAQHAAVNVGQYDIYGFVPNAPVGMRRPPPTRKGVADPQMLLDSLPDKFTTAGSIGLANRLSQFSENEIYLGTSPHDLFLEEQAKRYIEHFNDAMEGLAGHIQARNDSLDVPCKYLIPGRSGWVTNSITI